MITVLGGLAEFESISYLVGLLRAGFAPKLGE
jgi:hypothetical protein